MKKKLFASFFLLSMAITVQIFLILTVVVPSHAQIKITRTTTLHVQKEFVYKFLEPSAQKCRILSSAQVDILDEDRDLAVIRLTQPKQPEMSSKKSRFPVCENGVYSTEKDEFIKLLLKPKKRK